MKQILLFGAGKSATVLIDYLLAHAGEEDWELTIADANLQLALDKINDHPAARAVSFDILDGDKRGKYIHDADFVISMLPPHLHSQVANDCLKYSRHLLTASYVDDEMRSRQKEIDSKKLLFLCEMGLDPGIDHMSAMKLIDEIQAGGGRILSFKSHCGGLVAPESDDNPWHYKISWNPRNIIMAGKAGAHFRDNEQEVKLSHEELFTADRRVTIPDIGSLSWYPNRDSLSYEPLYGLKATPTFIRTTLRHPDFMRGWKKIIDLHLTDETPVYQAKGRSLQAVFKEHLKKNGLDNWQRREPGNIESENEKIQIQLAYLRLDEDETVLNKSSCSPADILQFAVEKRLGLRSEDKDMIVMLHEFEYLQGGKKSEIRSSLVVKGENSLRTAMAKTVGLPLAIAAKLILKGTIKLTGLRIPTAKEIYEPVLKELEEHEIKFQEQLTDLS